jgi:hypothetical protein
MSIRSRSTAIAFASLLAIAAAPLAAFAAMPLPGQPGADTSLGQELRGQPYPASNAFSQHVAPVETMKTMQTSMSVYGSLSVPANLVYN